MADYGVPQENWKTKFLVAGTLVGAVLGFATAFMLARASEERGDGPPTIDTMDALKVGIGVIGTMRAIAALADD